MLPAVAAALGVAAAATGYLVYDGMKKPAAPAPAPPTTMPPGYNPQAPGTPVTSLTKGYGYAVVAEFDVTKIPGDSSSFNQDNAANYIQQTFNQAGFKVLSLPQPQSDAELAKFAAKQPSAWVFTAQWTLDQNAVSKADPAIPSAVFYAMPTAV